MAKTRSPETIVTWPEHPDAKATIRTTATRARAIITGTRFHGPLPQTVDGKNIDWNKGWDVWRGGRKISVRKITK